MKVLSITELITLNKQLSDNNLGFQIHLSDACGGQSFWLECLNKAKENTLEPVITIINTFFKENRISIECDNNHKSFWIKG